MSETSYTTELGEDIVSLANRVEQMKTNTAIIQLINNQIPPREAISKIYLENMEKPPPKKKI